MSKDIDESKLSLVELVIIQARRDALFGNAYDKADALRYFRSEEYSAHKRQLNKIKGEPGNK